MAAARKKALEETDKLTRIAIVNADKCKPKRCRQECKKSCPVVRMGKVRSIHNISLTSFLTFLPPTALH